MLTFIFESIEVDFGSLGKVNRCFVNWSNNAEIGMETNVLIPQLRDIREGIVLKVFKLNGSLGEVRVVVDPGTLDNFLQKYAFGIGPVTFSDVT
jgi:hypothetical protein